LLPIGSRAKGWPRASPTTTSLRKLPLSIEAAFVALAWDPQYV